MPNDGTERTGGTDHEALLAQAEEVARLNAERRRLERRAVELRERALERRAELLLEVHEELGANGRARYGNAEAREAGVLLRQRDDAAYREIERERRATQEEYDRVAVAYALAKDRQDIWLAAAGVARPLVETNYKTTFESLR
jgi:hypothetical protein